MATATIGSAASTPGVARPESRRHWGLLIFFTIAALSGMSVLQTENNERGSLAYWVFILPAVVLPLFDVNAILTAFRGPAKLMLAFLVTAGTWHLAMSGLQTVIPIIALVLVTTWISTSRARFSPTDIATVYVLTVAVGAILYATTGSNLWGLLPGQTSPLASGTAWRASIYPNIALTGVFSFAVMLVLTRDSQTIKSHLPVLALVIYFALLSFVRTVLIATVLYAAMRLWFVWRPHQSPKRLFWTAIVVAIGVHLAIAFSAVGLVGGLQQYPIVQRLLLQNNADLSPDQILAQIYRPLLWGQHFGIFTGSPWLMGLGEFDIRQVSVLELIPDHPGGGTESFPTRLLAMYGLPAIFFFTLVINGLKRAAAAKDVWACAAFPPLVLFMMNWGGAYHPTTASFAVFMCILLHGRKAFASG
jgi:hypothetical protein